MFKNNLRRSLWDKIKIPNNLKEIPKRVEEAAAEYQIVGTLITLQITHDYSLHLK